MVFQGTTLTDGSWALKTVGTWQATSSLDFDYVPYTRCDTYLTETIKEKHPEICTHCGAPLKSNTCEYCGVKYQISRKE